MELLIFCEIVKMNPQQEPLPIIKLTKKRKKRFRESSSPLKVLAKFPL